MDNASFAMGWQEGRSADSADALWQWNTRSDRLILNPQAASLLAGQPSDTVRSGLEELCASLPAGRGEGVRQLFEAIRQSTSGTTPESLALVGGRLLCCRAIVLERSSRGRPRVLLGALSPLDGRGRRQEAGGGTWVMDLARGEYALDRACARLLRLPPTQGLCVSRRLIRNLLTSESLRLLVDRFSHLVLDPDHDGHFMEHVSLRLPDGSRGRFLLRGTCVGRDSSGSPCHMTGTLVREDGDGEDAVPRHVPADGEDSADGALCGGGDGYWDWDMETDTIYYSPRYLAMLGYDARTFGHSFASWRDRLHPDERENVLKQHMDVIMSPRNGDSYELSFRMRTADGGYRWILSRTRVLRRNSHGRATRIMGQNADITAIREERDRLAEMIGYDRLTDARSLVYFYHELERLEKLPGTVASIISCDVNGLKLLNDHLGHEAGNSMLRTAARLLRSAVRATDCVARLGGDEFAVLLPQCGMHDAARVLEKIRSLFRQYNDCADNIPVIMAFGLSGSEEAPSLQEALRLADRRMLHEKHADRTASGHRIKAWIEKRKDCVVSLEDSRYEG